MRARRGTVTILTVIVIFALVSIGAVMLSISTTHSRSTSGHQTRLRNLLIASAGVHAAVAEINSDVDQHGDGLGTLPQTAFDSGSYQVRATYDATNDEYLVVSIGRLAGKTRTLEAVVKRPWYPIFRFGLFGDRELTVLDGTLTDSVDSDLSTPVDKQKPTREGDVGSNGPVTVQPGSPVQIHGDLFSSAVHRDLITGSSSVAVTSTGQIGVTGDVRTGFGSINLGTGATVDGNVTTGEGSINASGATIGGLTDTNGPPVPDLDFSELYDGVKAAMSTYGGGSFNDAPFGPSPAASGGAKVTVAAGDTLTLGAGSHSYATLDVRGTLIVTGDASIGVSGNFIVREGAQVIFQGATQLDAGKVLMYGTTSGMTAEKPLSIRSLGSSSPQVRFAGNLEFKDNVTVASNGDIIGMDLASMTFQKQATLAAQGMMEFKSGATYTFNGDATVDAKGTIVWKENSTVNFNGKTVIDADVVDVRIDSTVNFNGPDTRVFAKSHLEVKSDVALSSAKPANLWWYVHGSSPTVDLKENGTFYGGLVVPNGDVDIKSGLEIYGAAQGRSVTFRQGAKLHYDLAFGKQSDWQDLKYRVISWREIGN